MSLPSGLQKLIEHFQDLPGIGPRQAARFVFALLRQPADRVRDFGEALADLPNQTQRCILCHRIMEADAGDACDICRDDERDTQTLCVVINDSDLEALEETDIFTGRYHLLRGHIDPVDEEANATITLETLMRRLETEEIDELILGMDSTTQGDITAKELRRRIDEAGINNLTITRLGRGLSTGSEIEYMDEETLRFALQTRDPNPE